MGVGVTFFAACIDSLSRIHGGKLVGPHDKFNEIIAHLGEAEQRWKELAFDPHYKPDDDRGDDDEPTLPAEQVKGGDSDAGQ